MQAWQGMRTRHAKSNSMNRLQGLLARHAGLKRPQARWTLRRQDPMTVRPAFSIWGPYDEALSGSPNVHTILIAESAAGAPRGWPLRTTASTSAAPSATPLRTWSPSRGSASGSATHGKDRRGHGWRARSTCSRVPSTATRHGSSSECPRYTGATWAGAPRIIIRSLGILRVRYVWPDIKAAVAHLLFAAC